MKKALIFQALCILPLLCGCSALCPTKTTAVDSAGKKAGVQKMTGKTASEKAKNINYRDYQLKESHRVLENIEWSEHFSYNTKDTASPRVLLIGDSICNGYQNRVRQNLQDRANITYWISSKCVTDPSYLRELEMVLDYQPISMITFNNGLHSLSSNRKEWKEAYDGVIRFIIAKCPNAKLTIVSSTPLKDPAKTEVSRKLADISKEIAEKYHTDYLDFFTYLDKLDRETYWGDVFHLKENGRNMLADKISEHIAKVLHLPEKGSLTQLGTETGPNGALK